MASFDSTPRVERRDSGDLFLYSSRTRPRVKLDIDRFEYDDRLQTLVALARRTFLIAEPVRSRRYCCNRSALAAQTKSLSVRPSILWVQRVMPTLPQVRKISGW